MFDIFYTGPKPGLFAFERPADSLEHAASLSRTGYYWYIYGGNDYSNFDFSFEPAPWESDQIHVFPSQWQPDGEVYLANKDTVHSKQWHFRTEQTVIRKPPYKLLDYWNIPTNIDIDSFDFSWHPNIHEPAYEYRFPTQWQSAGGPVWSGTEGIKLVDDQFATAVPTTELWNIPEEINKAVVDFSWHPNPLDPPYIYHFGSNYQVSVGLTYTVNNATEIKFAGPVPGTDNPLEVLDIFFIDRGNPLSQPRYDRLAQRHAVTKVRYANSIMDTVRRCVTRAKTNKCWIISSEYDYSDFDFAWHAEPWQNYMTHVFPSQHNRWSDTFLINRWEFERHSQWAAGLEEFPNLNFVTNQLVTKTENLCNIYYVDHGNPESQTQYNLLKKFEPDIILTRFVDNYLDTMKRIMSTADTEYVWILNSICNYDFFDFTWQPEPWQNEMIHCFTNREGLSTNDEHERRGDTFYIHVASFKTQMVELEMLDWFNVINYNTEQPVERWPVPVVHYKTDNLIEVVKNHTFTTPYVLFTNSDQHTVIGETFSDSTCLWTEKNRVVREYTQSRATTLVPRDVKRHLKTQIYDYPYLNKEKSHKYYAEMPLDIIYISNGEPDEQKWFEHTEYQTNSNVKWIRGVNGRTAAYQAAARASKTPWFFAVFAKLEVSGNRFPWYTWQPDYWQGPKHYIFNARNPLNGLEYGHQGMIAYNKKLVLENNNPGIDFTLSQPHESVPILSGTAHFNQTPWMTWRTAFREVVKLKHFSATQPSVETDYRLKVWCTRASGDNAGWCIQGAKDAVEYYESVDGDYSKLLLTFEWAWLKEYFDAKY